MAGVLLQMQGFCCGWVRLSVGRKFYFAFKGNLWTLCERVTEESYTITYVNVT